jgi:hypothetical protein
VTLLADGAYGENGNLCIVEQQFRRHFRMIFVLGDDGGWRGHGHHHPAPSKSPYTSPSDLPQSQTLGSRQINIHTRSKMRKGCRDRKEKARTVMAYLSASRSFPRLAPAELVHLYGCQRTYDASTRLGGREPIDDELVYANVDKDRATRGGAMNDRNQNYLRMPAPTTPRPGYGFASSAHVRYKTPRGPAHARTTSTHTRRASR